MKKSVMLMVGILAMALAGSAQAATMFAVQDSATPANDVFAVAQDGQVSAANMMFKPATKKFGFGTTNPLTTLHVVEESAAADRGLTLGQHFTANAGATIAINRSNGTLASPSNLAINNVIAAFHAKPYDALNTQGNFYVATGSLVFTVDGAASDGVIPTATLFFNGSDAASRLERLRISSNGRIRVSNQPAAPANNATCTVGDVQFDAPNGFLYMCTSANSWKRTAFSAY